MKHDMSRVHAPAEISTLRHPIYHRSIAVKDAHHTKIANADQPLAVGTPRQLRRGEVPLALLLALDERRPVRAGNLCVLGRKLAEGIAEVVLAVRDGRGEGSRGVEGWAKVMSVDASGCGQEGRERLTSTLPRPCPRRRAFTRHALSPSKAIKPVQVLRAHARLASLTSSASLTRLFFHIRLSLFQILQIPEVEFRLLRAHAQHRPHVRCVQQAEAVVEAVGVVDAEGEETLETCGASVVWEG